MRQYFLNDHPLCVHCQEAGYTQAAVELDHIKPVHKRPDLFWDRTNWQGLCKECHQLKSDAEWHAERRKRVWGSTIDGDPIAMDEGAIRLIGGSVGSGKTTYVQQQHTPGDLILDTDLLWHALLGGSYQPQPFPILPYVLAARRAVLTTLAERRDVNAWVISADHDRPRFNQLATTLQAEVIILNTPRALCHERTAARPYSARPPDTWAELVDRWHDTFTLAASDRIIREE